MQEQKQEPNARTKCKNKMQEQKQEQNVRTKSYASNQNRVIRGH